MKTFNMENIIEEWKDCPEYEQVYQVSNLGRVKSKPVFVENDSLFGDEGGYVKHIKIKNQTINRYGYMTTKLCFKGKCRRLTIHRLVAKAFIPNPNKYSQVNHIDGNKKNNSVTNLEWVSAAQNTKHAWDTGLITSEHMKGSKHHNSKVNEDIVKDIRSNKTLTKKELAEKYDISISTVADILRRKTWTHID